MALPITASMLPLVGNGVPEFASAALPFTFADPAQEISGPLMRDPKTISYVASKAWKDLRISSTRSRSTPPQDLSLLPSIQLDIVLEILGYLHSLELVQISRTNKSFHHLLNSAATDLTWRNSFLVEDHPDRPEARLPLCPSAISGRRWTKLLFGPQTCWECGQSGTDPDYTIWRRVCARCAEGNLLDTIPGYSEAHELNSIVHRTWLYMQTDQELGRFWRSDGLAIAAQYEACTENGGSEAVLQFIEEQRILVAKNIALSAECHNWVCDIFEDTNTSMYFERQYRITSSVMKRLIAEGFDERDVNASSYYIRNCEVLSSVRRLTSKLWYRTRPHVLPYVIGAQTRRLTYERETRLRLRKKAIIAIALMALRTPVPNLQYAYYAPPNTIHNFPPFVELFNQDSDEPISLENVQLSAALTDASAFVEAWADETQALLVSLLAEAQAEQLDFRLLDLATSVFRVCKTNARTTELAIGWEEARAHLHWFQGYLGPALSNRRAVEFSPRGSSVAAHLVMMLGMDPETATTADMDRADERFCCGTCPVETQGRRRVMGWRDCVLHVGSNPPPSHDEPSWLRLSPIVAADVRRREDPDDYSVIPAWSCTLCTDYSPSFEIQKYLEDHIRRTHLVDKPIKGEHFILFKGSEPPRRRAIMLFVAGANVACYRCNRCAREFPDVVKLFPKRTIRRHIQERHSAESSDNDWTEVELLASTPGS